MSRIAFITTQAFVPWAGSEELWSQTARRMAVAGHIVGVNVPHFENEARQVTQLAQTANVELHRSARRWPLWRRIARKLVPVQNSDIDGWLDRFRPDLAVISQGCTTDGLAWMQACLKRGVRYVPVAHLSTDAIWPDATVVAEIAPLYEAAAVAFFVSENNRRVTAKHLGIPLDSAKIVRNPFIVPFDNQTPWPVDDGSFKLACVGRLGAEHKGQDLLFEVMRDAKWRGRPITISLVGEGHHRATLERLAKLWDVRNIRLPGQQHDIEAVWAAHHALIMPSRYEGLPLALVEAMLCRRMAIATDVGGHRELIDDGVNGFLAAAPTPHFIDDALERAWQRRNDWKRMGEAAGEKIRATIPRDPVGVFIAELERLLA